MLLLKGALKHTFLNLKKDTNKKTGSNNRLKEPPYTLCTLILAYASCRFMAKVFIILYIYYIYIFIYMYIYIYIYIDR